MLTGFLIDRDEYRLGGDFYGNGGTPHTVSEKAAAALAAIGRDAVPALRKKLHDPHHRVHEAAATSLGLMGADGSPAVDRLIELTADKSHHVHRRRVKPGSGHATERMPRSEPSWSPA